MIMNVKDFKYISPTVRVLNFNTGLDHARVYWFMGSMIPVFIIACKAIVTHFFSYMCMHVYIYL